MQILDKIDKKLISSCVDKWGNSPLHYAAKYAT